ncbi:uncharacterized protein [Palaemon carinicauda]|uniref:uncharacterized protein n=1 Tax=Palaemon carinicauda TaxID=392227 RepID=UPI0035B5E876
MDQERPWSRGRSGWGSDGLGHREGTDSHSQSPRRVYHSGPQSHHKYTSNRPIWDDTVHDLASMRLTPAELARKLASRQSSNLVLARAQLLEQSRRPGSHNPNLPPALAARLQAARQQSVDSVLAQSNAMLLASQKIRQSEYIEQGQESSQMHRNPGAHESTTGAWLRTGLCTCTVSRDECHHPHPPPPGQSRYSAPQDLSLRRLCSHKEKLTHSGSGNHYRSPYSYQQRDGQEDTSATENTRREGSSGRTTPQPTDMLKAAENHKTVKPATSPVPPKEVKGKRSELGTPRDSGEKSSAQTTPKLPVNVQKPARRLSADGAATRTSLDHTITMVVNTCRELWQQLQEERVTRERLQQQLHQQGNVITTLTSELLQIQDQQEAILQEVSDARASGLWGGDTDFLGGIDVDRGEDLAMGHTMGSRSGGGRPSPQLASGRHPQRSILRANRTIHQPHLRQSPPYQSHHQSRTFTPLPYQPPHSPRPHQPSPGSRDSSPPLSGVPPIMRSEANSNHYRSSISKQIRDALSSGQASSYASDLTKISSQLNKETMQLESSQEMKSMDKERVCIEKQASSSANKENAMSHVDGNVMDSGVTELQEKTK